MEKISYEDWQNIKIKIEQGRTLEKNERKIEEFIKKGNKYTRVIENILKENPVSMEELMEYFEKTSKLIEAVGFASDFLVKELPKEYINVFEKSKWQSITKITKFTGLEYESKKSILKLCGVFGVFENDPNSGKRNENLKEMLQNLNIEDIKKFSGFNMTYDPQFLDFFLKNLNDFSSEKITEIQNRWEEIRKSVEVKSTKNILNYIDLSNKSENQFQNYMKVNGISKAYQKKYEVLYRQMAERTKTSMPTLSSKSEKGYTYEILNFNDPRILRFGNDNLIKCCQKLGGNGEGSMINSAIESTSRVLMVSDESGELIAGSLVTHQIGKDGRSHVCFDSIEVNANRARIKADDYNLTLNRIERLKQKGLIKDGTIEELKQYYQNNPPKERKITKYKMYKLLEKGAKKSRKINKIKIHLDNNPKYFYITGEDIRALEENKKILDVYKQASEDMVIADEKKRMEQLKNGEISKEEYSHLLMKNGLFTIGRNPVSMYLGSLEKLDKKSMEKLPIPQKDRSIYKEGGYNSVEKRLTKVPLIIWGSMFAGILGMTALGIVGFGMGFGVAAIAASAAIASDKIVKKNKIKGVYSDASKEQRILRDGRKEEDITKDILSILKRKKLQQKLVYNEVNAISNPVELSKLTLEEKNKLRRLSETNSKGKEIDLSGEKMVIGNLENWAAIFSNNTGKLVLENVLLPGSMSLHGSNKRLTDAQKDLLDCVCDLAQSRNVEFNCDDKNINKYFEKNVRKRSIIRNRGQNIKEFGDGVEAR